MVEHSGSTDQTSPGDNRVAGRNNNVPSNPLPDDLTPISATAVSPGGSVDIGELHPLSEVEADSRGRSDDEVAGLQTDINDSVPPPKASTISAESAPQPVRIEVLPANDDEPGVRIPGADVDIEQTTVSIGLTGISLQRMRATATPNRAEIHPLEGVATVPDTADESPTSKDEEREDQSEFETVRLLSRFLVGLALEGTDELLVRLRAIEKELAEEHAGQEQLAPLEDRAALARSMAVGTLLWSQQAALRSAYRGAGTAFGITSRAVGLADRLTDNVMLRPVRRPIHWSTAKITTFAQARIAEGRVDEHQGRALAVRTLDDFVSGFIDYISENPELTELISESGLSLAGTVVDNSRQVGVAADGILENLVRRVFKRKSRDELPTSPYVGKLQDMYTPDSLLSQEEPGLNPEPAAGEKE